MAHDQEEVGEGSGSKLPEKDSSHGNLTMNEDMPVIEDVPIEVTNANKFLPHNSIHVLEQIMGNDKEMEYEHL